MSKTPDKPEQEGGECSKEEKRITYGNNRRNKE